MPNHLEGLKLRVEAVHRLNEVRLAELNLADTRGLEDAAARVGVCVHLHHLLVNRRVNDDPRAAAELAVRRNISEDGVLVGAKVIDDVRTKLEDLAKHVAGAAREATPVGEDDEREILGRIEVSDSLRCLEGRVRVPDLAGLGEDSLTRGGVSRISGDALLDEARFHGNDAHRDAAKAGAANND
eukprot:scaffold55875_cov26-Tisochrysis_lutea.AAC.6